MRPYSLHGHERPLTLVKYNREGDLLFTAARDKSPNVWFSHNGERLGSFDGHNGAIFSLCISASSERLMTASADESVKLWDVSRGVSLFDLGFKTSARWVEYALGERMVCVLTEQRKNTNGFLNVYGISGDTLSDAPLQSIVMPGERATIASWGNLNKFILTAHEDGTIMKFDPLTGKKLQQVKVHDGTITDMQFSADKSYILTSSKDSSAKLIDATTLEVMKTYKSDRPLNSAASSPLFDQVIVGGGQDAREVTLTAAREGKFEVCFYDRVFENEIGKMKAHFSPINTLAFHPSGRSFASGAEEGYVRLYHFDDEYFDDSVVYE
ncbi:hypothetical protein MP638_001985 [Amoeboaphelidium occidentale]|nr:hypothetical protein MP638_001985 [Amoeboaphelidium occidentale]